MMSVLVAPCVNVFSVRQHNLSRRVVKTGGLQESRKSHGCLWVSDRPQEGVTTRNRFHGKLL